MQRALWESSGIMSIQPVHALFKERWAVITFLLSAKSASSTVDEPPADFLSSPRYHYFRVAMHVASLIATASLQASVLQCMLVFWLYDMCMGTCHAHRKCVQIIAFL